MDDFMGLKLTDTLFWLSDVDGNREDYSVLDIIKWFGGEQIWWCELSQSAWGNAQQHKNWYSGPEGHERCGWRWLVKSDG